MSHSHFYNIPRPSIQDNLFIDENKKLDDFVQDYPRDLDIGLIGHSHEQLYIFWKDKKIINTGSNNIT